MIPCSQARTQLEAFALGMLEPDEQRVVDDHLSGCPACRSEADALIAAANLLPLAFATVPASAPPDFLKSRVLDAIRSEAARVEPGNAPVPPAPAASATVPAVPKQIAASGSTLRNRLQQLDLRTVAAAAVVVLLAVALALGVRLSQALDREEALRAQVREVFTRQQEIVLEVVDSNQTERMLLLPLVEDSSSYGKVFTRSDLPHVVAMAARLPAPPEGMRYHLWLTEQGETALAGVLMLNDQGFGLLTFDADSDGPVYERALLTLQEPGANTPSGETILTWPDLDA